MSVTSYAVSPALGTGRDKVAYSPGTSSMCSATFVSLRQVSDLSKASSVGEAARTVWLFPIEMVPMAILGEVSFSIRKFFPPSISMAMLANIKSER